jgi:hypothetical protein
VRHAAKPLCCRSSRSALLDAMYKGGLFAVPRARTLHTSNRTVSLIHFQDRALPSALFRRLRRGVRAVGDERMSSTYETTFWFDLGRPRSLVEEAVVSIASLLQDQSVVGVEWWLSRMTTSRVRVDFHQDRDEKRSRRGGTLRHPRVSSVLFLNRVRGGALAVTAQPPNAKNPSSVPLPLDADLIAPRANRLVWFDGRLTHGVLDADNRIPGGRCRTRGELRLSVVMNWWSTRPMAVPRFAEVDVYGALKTSARFGPALPSLASRD